MTNLAGRQLHSSYLEYRRGAVFAADTPLYGLCRSAWRAAHGEQGAAKLTAMMLALIFGDAASKIGGRAIDAGDATRWFDLMDQPILRSLDLLIGRSDESTETVLADLATAYDRVSPEISDSSI